jgi:hypothetical protein
MYNQLKNLLKEISILIACKKLVTQAITIIIFARQTGPYVLHRQKTKRKLIKENL